ncbi:hypothetical protein SAMN05216573_102467 [Bradyrhizobium sp. Rc3b]|nr:hypothetical protein [Bradyrhizobium sp. SBR1B]SFM55234.1 hypothetical protein SAMN05216573_102467 [Bradyrhizobium sp. Rc3b]
MHIGTLSRVAATLVLGTVLMPALANAQNVQRPNVGTGVTSRTLPNPNTPRVQPQGLQTGSYANPAANRFNTPPSQPDFALSGPYVGMKYIGNVR